MKLHILGKNPQEKGKQLEYLTLKLLEYKGFTDIAARVVSSGGHEIDVWAEKEIITTNSSQAIKVICECKAHSRLMNLPDWLKFLGKIYIEKMQFQGTIHGYFIALSGINGNVKGSYEALKNQGKEHIEILTGSSLIDSVSKIYSLPNAEQIRQKVSQITRKQNPIISLCYYKRAVYWLVEFEIDEIFTILTRDGDEFEPSKALMPLFCEISSGHFTSLRAEHEAYLKRMYNEKAVLTALMLLGGKGTLQQIFSIWMEIPVLSKPQEHPSIGEFAKALERLSSQKLIYQEDSGYQLLKGSKIEHIAQFYKYFLEGEIIPFAIGSQFYDKYITVELLAYICKVQNNLRISPEDQEFCLKLLLWSPSALFASLHFISMVADYRRNQTLDSEQANNYDVDTFMRLLYDYFVQDYRQVDFAHYFFRVRNIREIDIMHIFKAKGDEQVILEKELRWRNALAQAQDPKTKYMIYWHLPLTNDAPEPWNLKEAS